LGELGGCGPKVFRNNHVGHGKIIPRHSFISWLAIRRRLYTQDKIIAIGFLQEMKCVFCGSGEENINPICLFVVHSQKIFGAIFEIDAIFLELVGTGRSLFGG
jgi:hypothetical protein